MWREITRRERSHVRRMEMKRWRRRRIAVLGYTVFALLFVVLLTAAGHDRERNAVSNEDMILELLYALGSGGQEGEKSPAAQLRLVQEARVDLMYRKLYIAECAMAAAGYVGYYYFACRWNRKYLAAPLMVQNAVCTGTKEVRRRSWHSFYVNVRTEDGEKLRELWVPWSIGEEIAGENLLLLVREGEGEEPRVYPLKSSRGI